jgi:hypothetical protein
MNWTNLEQATKILGDQKNEIKNFLVSLNNIFYNPRFEVKDDYTFENKGDSILIIVRFDPQWQAEIEEVNEIKKYNSSKITEVRLHPREEQDGCYIHIKWLKNSQVPANKNKRRKNGPDDE